MMFRTMTVSNMTAMAIWQLLSRTNRESARWVFDAPSVGLAMGFFVLLLSAGLSVQTSLLFFLSTAAFGLWGFLIIDFLGPHVIRPKDAVLWIFGPSICVGSLFMLLIRLFSSPLVLMVTLFFLPVLLLVRVIPHTNRISLRHWPVSAVLADCIRQAVASIGLVGSSLVLGWTWLIPVSLICVLLSLFVSFAPFAPNVKTALAVGASTATFVWSMSTRPANWWQVASGIPFDETILESISNGLVTWGPQVNPLHHELDGASSVAYHHLLFLITGVASRVSGSRPYEALTILGPLTTRVSIVASLLLLVRAIQRNTGRQSMAYPLTYLGLFAGIVALNGEGFGSPSTWMGVAAFLGGINIVLEIVKSKLSFTALLLLGISHIAVAFSKGTFVVALSIFAVTYSLAARRSAVRLSLASLAVTGATLLWFTIASIRDDEFIFEFWPSRNMGSSFSVSLYSIKVFLGTLVEPLVILIVVLALLARFASPHSKWVVAGLTAVAGTSMFSQVMVTSTGPRSFELLFVPGIVAFAVGIVMLSVEFQPKESVSWSSVVGMTVCAAGTIIVSQSLGAKNLTPFLVGLSLILTYFTAVVVRERLKGRALSAALPRTLSSISVFVCFVVVGANVSQSFFMAEDPFHKNVERVSANWFGDEAFAEALHFIRENTSSDDLLAYTLCSDVEGRTCQADFRPAALSGRRFLALDPVFSQENVSYRLWRDVELSREIGKGSADETIRELADRGVTDLLIDRSRVAESWISEALSAGSALRFENDQFVLLAIDKGKTS